jgi:hypothetical protein
MKILLRVLIVIDILMAVMMLICVVSPTEVSIAQARSEFLNSHPYTLDWEMHPEWPPIRAKAERQGKTITVLAFAAFTLLNVSIVALWIKLKRHNKTLQATSL